MRKRVCYTELAWVLGTVFIALGVVFMERADFGVSMIVAPAYILYRWLSPTWSFVTFGMAEYCLQALLIVIMSLLLRRFQLSYLLSIAAAVVYGFVLDGFMLLGPLLPTDSFALRLVWFAVGVLLCTAGVAWMFRTYLSPEAYELLVKELSRHFRFDIHKCKTVYDCISCAVGIVMSLLIFGPHQFVGVKWGTIVAAIFNGWIISRFSLLYGKLFEFKDALPWRPFFVKDEEKVSDEH